MEDEYFYHAIPSVVDGNDIPLGMGTAFARDLSALGVFAALPQEKKLALIERAREIQDPDDMSALVSSILTESRGETYGEGELFGRISSAF